MRSNRSLDSATKTDILALSLVRRLAGSGEARRLREAAGISGPEMADAIGCAVSTLWRWEGGQRRPHGPAAVRYAEVLSELQRIDKGAGDAA